MYPVAGSAFEASLPAAPLRSRFPDSPLLPPPSPMKSFPTLLIRTFHDRSNQRNFVILLRFCLALLLMVAAYSVIFHILMEREDQHYSWITGVYWTLTVMSTLGFGDITFHTDLGRLFSLLVLLSGVVFLLVLLPFTFIEFFYAPWMESRAAARVPNKVPAGTQGHVVLTRYGPIAAALIERLKTFEHPYVVILSDFQEALEVHDKGVEVMLGDIDDPETYQRASIETAALMATTRDEVTNTSAVFAVREVNKRVPILATARRASAEEILRVAGCSRVLELATMMGQTLARRTRGTDATSHVIGQLEDVLIAEANAAETHLAGKTLGETKARDLGGVTVVGVWDRGTFELGTRETKIESNSVLVLAGSKQQLANFDYRCQEARSHMSIPTASVIIVGGGRVGKATARGLAKRGIDYRIIEMNRELVRKDSPYVIGDATDPAVLEKAGLNEASTIIVTTRNDDTNVYVTIYCRRVRPDVQIISRATVERKVATLHRAGSDFVYSYASMGANTLFNLLKRHDLLMMAEGLDIFKVKVPSSLVGKTIAESNIREQTGCSIVAVHAGEEASQINPPPDTVLATDDEIVLIGMIEAQRRFLEEHGPG